MASRHDVALEWRDGREEVVRVSEDETVLETAEAADVALPFGCRTGACGTCVGRLVDGDVSCVRPPRALKSRQREEGYVLCCVARPLTDCRIRVGAEVLTGLASNPWQ